MTRSPVRWLSALLCAALLSAGCGSAPADPFERVLATGTVTLDGPPIPWGTLNVAGARNEATSEQAIESYAIRDGQIMARSSGGAAGLQMPDQALVVSQRTIQPY